MWSDLSENMRMIIEEIGMDGVVGLGKCSSSTAYRYKKLINDHLAKNKCGWRVKVSHIKGCSMYDLVAVSAEEVSDT